MADFLWRFRWIFYERPDGIDAAAPEAIADHPRQPALEIQVKPPTHPPPHANDMQMSLNLLPFPSFHNSV